MQQEAEASYQNVHVWKGAGGGCAVCAAFRWGALSSGGDKGRARGRNGSSTVTGPRAAAPAVHLGDAWLGAAAQTADSRRTGPHW